jgi:NAD(P)-dependent dehydrogenase (short-subunit alcohol dehydrogenase family)
VGVETELHQDDSRRVVVITGGGGGIGRSLAETFSQQGDHVVVIDRDSQAAAGTVEAVQEHGGTAVAMVADVASSADVEQACAAILEKHGRVDVLCNNAAVRDHRLDAAELSPEAWEQVMGVNVTGTFLFSHYLLPAMLEREHGVIINMSSIGGIAGGRAGAAYTASKHAMIGLTKNVAFAFAERGIRCNAICPGSVDTEFSAAFGKTPHPNANPRFTLATALRPNGRIPTRDISAIAVFLASDEARAINGHALVADGGWIIA